MVVSSALCHFNESSSSAPAPPSSSALARAPSSSPRVQAVRPDTVSWKNDRRRTASKRSTTLVVVRIALDVCRLEASADVDPDDDNDDDADADAAV